MLHLLLFREEIQNKSLMRFGRTHIPQVNNIVCKSRFSLLRAILDFAQSSFVMYQASKITMDGGANFLSIPIVVQDLPEFIIVDSDLNDLATPADLDLLALPDIPDPNKGVVVMETGKQWLTSYLVVEYSKIAKWVAVGMSEAAVIVFSIGDTPKIGSVIML